jgi:hypothetical protein
MTGVAHRTAPRLREGVHTTFSTRRPVHDVLYTAFCTRRSVRGRTVRMRTRNAHSSCSRGGTSVANVDCMSELPSDPRATSAHTLEPLSRLAGRELEAGTPDVRGWEVTSPTSMHLGVVNDLLVDLASSCVRYLDVVLDAEPSTTRHVLLPIGKVWINDALDEIVVPASPSLDRLPTYDPARFDRQFEHDVLAAFGDEAAADFYMASAFDVAGGSRARGERSECARRESDEVGAACPIDRAAVEGTEAANGVELRVIPEAAD